MATPIVRRCSACGAANRAPARYLSHTGRCGACKAPLPPVAEPLDVDAASFEEIVREAGVPVLTDFWAPWCGPCRMAAPEVRALAREMAGEAVVLKVNTEEQPELAARYRIQSIPSFLILRDGRVALRKVGVAPRAEMRRWLEAARAAA